MRLAWLALGALGVPVAWHAHHLITGGTLRPLFTPPYEQLPLINSSLANALGKLSLVQNMTFDISMALAMNQSTSSACFFMKHPLPFERLRADLDIQSITVQAVHNDTTYAYFRHHFSHPLLANNDTYVIKSGQSARSPTIPNVKLIRGWQGSFPLIMTRDRRMDLYTSVHLTIHTPFSARPFSLALPYNQLGVPFNPILRG
ncbi:uncharacterized protein L969DRAFT_102141 [Mixia osmundae IAM 14324]|uniref:Uncharacterized protein n=1 Tax=Mixia osmundae (strain CBS 9802 / IAM 14324 / JCM 22182 / KY 12970) TaxID=764103 RepID=G7E5T5_MIXOS|nr:uncharacterized protein L969DRAFT_102141 [Mixia osmundae IAM 14324]KEI40653.1 hypothetical protein L969DRAFT_102141 [Mixia osmundae IAM 14324]GAA98195.1 hypothetical protein E5Q_04878 [Mixia osmundae IAM 14324]